MQEQLINSWYVNHLKVTWDEAFGEKLEEAKKLKDKDYDPNRYFKQRITQTRWFMFIINWVEPTTEMKTLLLKEFYANRSKS
jgi:hypothetical protein